MARKSSRSPVITALKRACHDEAQAVGLLEQMRWGESPACPRCSDMDVYQMQSRGGGREANYRWRCRGCGDRFTVRTGAIFEESRLPLSVWCHALWRACASKKGVSAKQIERECEVSYKTALYLMHRIRWAMAEGWDGKPPLKGTVEVDETYVGGKPRYRKKRGEQKQTGRGTRKTPVVALVERGGNVRLQVMERVTARHLGQAIAENVDQSSRLITDDFGGYRYVGRYFRGGHEKIRHKYREYVRKGTDVHSNTVEGVFSLLKRGVMGTFHSISKRHLHRYLSEFEYRHNTRHDDDGERVRKLVRQSEGRRLVYTSQTDVA